MYKKKYDGWRLLAAASFFVMGVGPIRWVISTTTPRQTVTPSRRLGRVAGFLVG